MESHLMRERYLVRMVEQAVSLKEALKMADSSYWKCDPKHQVEGETYLQLTRLLQVCQHQIYGNMCLPYHTNMCISMLIDK